MIDGAERLATVGHADDGHYVGMAAALIMLGRFDDALDTSLGHLSAGPNDPEDGQRLAVLALYRLGRDEEALALCDEYLDDSEDDPLLWQLKARIVGRRGDVEHADRCRNRARELLGPNRRGTWAMQVERAAANRHEAGAKVYRRLTQLITADAQET